MEDNEVVMILIQDMLEDVRDLKFATYFPNRK